MEDQHDDWKLGDEGDGGACPRCGRRNRPGLSHCVICGTRLGDGLETDPESLRTIGETMGRGRPGRSGGGNDRSLRAWTIASVTLIVVVAVLTWLETRETPFRLEDLTEPAVATPLAVAPVPTAVAARVLAPTARPLPPTARPAPPTARPTPLRTALPPRPTALPTSPPVPRATAVPVVVAPPAATLTAGPVATPAPPPTAFPTVEPTAVETRPIATEKPSLGTDLQEATRAYRAAVDVHNARVDEYNALADEIQRRNAFDDDAESVALRRRLDRTREAVESARAYAEGLRVRMEAVRSRYR